MFVPKYFFDKFIEMIEKNYAIGQNFTERGLQRVLEAKDSEVKAVIAAKDVQITFMAETIKDLKASVDHERQRAEAAVDILLTKNGDAGPIRNADLIREAAEREAKEGSRGVPRPDPAKAFHDVMKSLGQVGEDDDDGPVISATEKFTVGGIPA